MGFSLYKTALLRALYLTMFHGFLRVGEATSKSSAASPIQYSDLTVNTQGAVVILRQFKHSKMPHRVELMRDKEGSICPVRWQTIRNQYGKGRLGICPFLLWIGH